MKKISILCVLAAACNFASAITTTTTTVAGPSSLVGVNALAGEDAYAWGISVGAGQTITSATLSFSDLTLTAANASGKGILYADLLNSTLTGVHTYFDNDAVGDYFTGHYTANNLVALGVANFASVGTTIPSWTITFNTAELTALNLFIGGHGIFDIGLDPDCHYNVGGLSLCYTTTCPTTTPDTATTIYLLGLGLLALEVSRRKFAPAK